MAGLYELWRDPEKDTTDPTRWLCTATVLTHGDGSPSTLGTDGKQYPRRCRPTAATACATCGETHPAGTRDCPWDLFAQGRAPRLGPSQPDEDDEASDSTVAGPVNPEPRAAQVKPSVQQQESVKRAESNDAELPVTHGLTTAVERAQCPAGGDR